MNFVSNDNATTLVTAIAGEITNTQAMVAPAFSATNAYAIDDVVTYNDVLYQFNTAHPAGAWVGTDATPITAAGLVADSGVTALTTAEVNALIALLS